MNWVGPAVSVTAGLGCLAGWVALWIIDKKSVPRVCQLLLLGGVTGVLGVSFARPVRHLMDMLEGTLQRWAVANGVAVIVGLSFALLVFIAARAFVRKEITDTTMIVTAALPLIVPFIAGRLGDVATAIVYGPANLAGSAVANLLGLF